MASQQPSGALRFETVATRPDLVETVARWHFAEWGAGSPSATLAEWTAGIRRGVTSGGFPATYLALDPTEGDALVATASLVEADMDTRPDLTPWVAGVFVRPDRRGAGVGSALMRYVVAEAARLGLPRLYLYTHSARAFYERLGWRATEQTHYEGQDVTIMTLTP